MKLFDYCLIGIDHTLSIDTMNLETFDGSTKWRILNEAAKRAAAENGYEMKRRPGRGMSNVWEMTKSGVIDLASIRTSRNRWIAYQPSQGGKRWKTLDDVTKVLISTVVDPADPTEIEVYLIDAESVRQHFSSSYKFRTENNITVTENFGMWVCLDPLKEPISCAGIGITAGHVPIAKYSVSSLEPSSEVPTTNEKELDVEVDEGFEEPLSIADAKRRLALTLGVAPSSIRITIEA